MKQWTIQEIAQGMQAEILQEGSSPLITNFSFSSREGDAKTMFLPVVGERVDAHDYIADAYHKGMLATVTERNHTEPDTEGMTYLHVDNTRDALQRFGAWVRAQYKEIPMAAITGSVGKTTTKEMVSAALSPLGTILKTEGNKNGQLGVPLMMLPLAEKPAAAVIEMGMSLFGEMARIAAVSQPDAAIITNIGVSHIGNLHSQENIRREKLCILNQMHKPGVVLVNGDDALLREFAQAPESVLMYEETRKRLKDITIYTFGTTKDCDYRAENIVLLEDGSHFTYVSSKETLEVTLSVPGMHNVSNAIAALSAAELFGADIKKAAEALQAYRPIAMRGGMETIGGGIRIIDDTYNASPDSMKSGLDVLAGQKAGRRIAVLADILELGEQSEACHRLVGRYVAERPVQILIAVGKEAAFLAKEAEHCRQSYPEMGPLTVMHFEDRKEAQEALAGLLQKEDCVLLKGSRGMGLDVTVRYLKEQLQA